MSPLVLSKGDIPSVAWPAVHSHRTAPLAAMIHQIEATQWLDPEAIEVGQRTQLGMLAQYFAAQSEAFRTRLASAGLTAEGLAEPGGFQKLPPLTRREVQSRFGNEPGFTLPNGHGPVAKVSTSGSTGVPVVVWKTSLNQLDWLAMTVRYYRWSEPDFRVRLAAVRALIKRTGKFPDWGTPLSHLMETGPMLAIDIATDLDVQIDQLLEFAPVSLIIYPSNLSAMMTRMAERGQTFESLLRIRTVGEQLSTELRVRVDEEWSLPVFDCYSSEEIGYLALQCPDGDGYHAMDETILLEVIDDEGRPCKAGETGRVIVTDLRNHATPVIRYDIGDYAIRGGPCTCGRGLSTLSRIMGRERNMIRNPDGTTHWPLTGYKEYRSIAPIVQYQMVQHSLTEIELRLVTERPLSDAEEEGLRRHLVEHKLKQPFDIRFSYFEGEIPKGARGKFEEFVSLMGDSK